MEDRHLKFDERYEKHIKPQKNQALKHQEDSLYCGDPECEPFWTSNEYFVNVFWLQHTPTCMSCASELSPDYDTFKSMVARYNPMETVKHVKLYFDTCATHMSTPFKEDPGTLNEEHTSVTLDGIASGLAI